MVYWQGCFEHLEINVFKLGTSFDSCQVTFSQSDYWSIMETNGEKTDEFALTMMDNGESRSLPDDSAIRNRRYEETTATNRQINKQINQTVQPFGMENGWVCVCVCECCDESCDHWQRMMKKARLLVIGVQFDRWTRVRQPIEWWPRASIDRLCLKEKKIDEFFSTPLDRKKRVDKTNKK